jgi:hypothetical protein
LNFRRERRKRGKKYSKKERQSAFMCLGFTCYPKYWRKAKTISSLQKKEEAKGFILLYDEDEENRLK